MPLSGGRYARASIARPGWTGAELAVPVSGTDRSGNKKLQIEKPVQESCFHHVAGDSPVSVGNEARASASVLLATGTTERRHKVHASNVGGNRDPFHPSVMRVPLPADLA